MCIIGMRMGLTRADLREMYPEELMALVDTWSDMNAPSGGAERIYATEEDYANISF